MKHSMPIFASYHIKLIFLLSIFLHGCQTTNIRDDYSLEESSSANIAIVIGTVSQNLSASKVTVSEFRIDQKNSNPTKTMYSQITNEFLGGLANKYEYQDAHSGGRIFVVEVTAGKHQLDYWAINHNNNYLTIHPKVPPENLEFNIERGQIMYLGNFHIDIESGRNLFNQKIPVGGVPSINNHYERDLKYFQEKYPNLSDQEVINNVLHEGKWLNEITEQEELVIPTSK